MKRALIIGIDDYPNSPLSGCVNDARAIAKSLHRNEDGSRNFSVKFLSCESGGCLTSRNIVQSIKTLFEGNADTALLYFAGHGLFDAQIGSGHIVSQDGYDPHWGMSLQDILGLANKAYPKIKSTIIILDCCHSGAVGDIPAMGVQNISPIGHGVTILTACSREQFAAEKEGHGLFTSILLEALNGGAADILGRITPAALYSYVDQTLSDWEQRPVYKANVERFITLRTVTPKIPLNVLRQLPKWFPEPLEKFQLDPSFEKDRSGAPELATIPVSTQNAEIFNQLQLCSRNGLIVPVDEEFMYYAAIKSKSCKLTALGQHYWNLAAKEII